MPPACAANARPTIDLGYEMMKRFLPVADRSGCTRRGCRSSMSMASIDERRAAACRSVRSANLSGRAASAASCPTPSRSISNAVGGPRPPSRPGSSTCSTPSASAKWRSASAAIRRDRAASCTPSALSAPSARAITELEAGRRARRARAVRHRLADRGGRRQGCRDRGRRPRPRAAAARPSIDVLANRDALRPRRPAVRQRAARTTSCIATSSSNGGARLDIDVEVTVDHADADWHGNVGVVTTLIRARELRSARTPSP